MSSQDINSRDLREEKKVLAITSLAEFAERYGYYIIQSLLIFYLIDKFQISQDLSASLVGTTLSMVYISAILGGFIAERYLGYYRAGLLGSLFMLSGFFILAYSTSQSMLYLGLSFISVSTGLIKSNMSAFIGRFYDKSSLNDSKRDFGFNIFYMGINLGSFGALFIASWLKDNYGYGAPFYSSMAVSAFMLCLLLVGFKFLNKHIIEFKLTLSVTLKVTLLLIVYIIVLFYIFEQPIIANLSIFVAVIASKVILGISMKKSSFKKVFVAGIFFLLSIIYWGLYFQIFISVLLFTQYSVDNSLLNPSQFLSVESLSVLFFAGILGKFWIYLDKKRMKVEDIDKFNIAFVLLTITFLVILVSILISPEHTKVSAYGIIFAYIILGVSELSLSAIGLSMITKIAPKGFVALYMGIWLLTLGVGGKLGGFLASFFYISDSDLGLSKANMSDGLDTFIVIAILTSIIILLLRRFVNKNV
ncbi:peptide MFS transporter [Francisella philomiragia]|uniref:Alkaline phosphatase n=1 Tax=Francisella philomiragia subsp. philomiragia (strain ATCC 25017 / CCUG 19701 / FSC 153 / O\|nr:peptide MFS transporter [Francisella philomiragia]AJI47841.1 amino acid/peptide transporter family protein [Francisella philomiragia]AJI49361.1 amino acid/peptide transporter family protein [Francisella philomiragia]AJI74599.1 amino acid/peptide transporter family protein [Francisella philomiragia subsp. philomiragia ATCC 25015]EET21920.1 proton-dependent oligopeptide transporter [Francisella philomiragia subsp. philomiragia ATCC 25015]MBK2020153.1 peptide MFS transporter [Francisella philo